MVQTPVGARCRDCANVKPLPTYQVPAVYYLRAVGAGLGVAVAVGLVWGLISMLLPFFYLNLLLAAGAGYAVGEVISLSANRKRGPWLAAIGGLALVLSYLIGILSPWGLYFNLFDLLALALGIYLAVSRLR